MSKSSPGDIVVLSLVYPSFELNIDQDTIRKSLLIKQETERIEWFCSFWLIPKGVFNEYFS